MSVLKSKATNFSGSVTKLWAFSNLYVRYNLPFWKIRERSLKSSRMHMKMKSESESVSCLVLSFCDPMDYIACQAPLSMDFSRQDHWSVKPFSSLAYLPNLGTEPKSSTLADRFFTIWATRQIFGCKIVFLYKNMHI